MMTGRSVPNWKTRILKRGTWKMTVDRTLAMLGSDLKSYWSQHSGFSASQSNSDIPGGTLKNSVIRGYTEGCLPR